MQNLIYTINLLVIVFSFSCFAQTDSVSKIMFQGGILSGFGHEVCNGDYNGDGIDDIIITSVKTNETAPLIISLFYGSSTIDTTVDLTILADTVYDYPREYCITNAGDINNDNCDDLLVSSTMFNNSTGRVLIFLGGNPMDAEYDFVLNGSKNYSGFGSSVSTAGDVNADGISDFLVASSIDYNLQIDTSKVFLYLGSTDLDTIPDLIYYSPYIEDSFGSSIASAGDINSDGFDDLLIGYEWFSDKVYVYLGSEYIQDSIAFIIQNNQIQSNFGYSMCGDNDFNLDGYDDIVIGAPRFDPLGGGSQLGRVYIYFGGESFNTVADLVLTGNEQFEQFGQSISGAGFFNEDNYIDLIINSPFSNNFYGSANIYFGSSNFDGNADITLYGDYTDMFSFGGTITNCDFNNDGLNELLFSTRILELPGKQNILWPDRVYLYSYVYSPQYKIQYEAKNFLLEDNNSFTFDVYIKNSGQEVWQYSHGSVAFTFNPNILHNGSLVWSIVPGFSEFPDSQKPDSAIVYNLYTIGTYPTLAVEGQIFNPGDELRYARFRIQTTDSTFSTQQHHIYFIKSGSQSTNSFWWFWNDPNGKEFLSANKSFIELNSVLLPVELILFTAKTNQSKVQLNWQTATELNNQGFEIQRKLENSGWVTLGFRQGKGTTTVQSNYFYEDELASINSNKLYYRLKQIDFNGAITYSYVVEVISQPLDFSISQNFPNPFNPITTIKYEIPKTTNVKIEIFDILGRKIFTLMNEEKSSGRFECVFNASSFGSGVYYYRIEAGEYIQTRKMLLLK